MSSNLSKVLEECRAAWSIITKTEISVRETDV